MIFRTTIYTIAENELTRLVEKSAVSDDAKNAFFDPIYFSQFVDTMFENCNKLELRMGMLKFDGAMCKRYVESRVVDYIRFRVAQEQRRVDADGP